MGAIHWGVAMMNTKQHNAKYFIASIIPALSAWVALLIPNSYAVILLMIGFITLIIFDWSVEKSQRLPLWYIPMRIKLTIVVIVCLTITQLSLVIPEF